MQNVPIPAAAMPTPANAAAPVVPDTTCASAPDCEDFSVVLARELGAEAIELRPDAAFTGAATISSQPQQAESEVAPPQIPSEPGLVAPAVLALLPGIQPSERVSMDQTTQSDSLREIQTTARPAALLTETSARHHFAAAAIADKPVPVCDNTADFAAPGKFLPPVAAPDKPLLSATGEHLAQRIPDVAPLPQMTELTPAPVHLVPVAAPATHNLKLDSRVGAPGWSGELAQKVVWMVTQKQQVAELHLNPPHLGPVEVRLTIGNDAGALASAQFTSPHLAVREAIETSLPRLREMLADNGIALGNVTVGADSFQQQAEAGREDRVTVKRPADMTQTIANGLAARPTAALIRSGHHGLVDTFA